MVNKLNILIVEDTKIAQKTAAMTLSALGCLIDTADSGKEALEKFKPGKYDLIFMDIGLPDIDGYTVTETIRSLEPQNNQTPIMALTAHMEDECRDKSSESGMNGFVSKPLTTDEAKRILEELA